MEKKKVVLLISDFNYGGAQRQLAALAKRIKKRGNFEPYIIHYYAGGALSEDLVNADINVTHIPKGGRFDFPGFYWRLVKHLKQIDPDIIHGYLDIPNLVASALKPLFPKSKIIWGIRGSGESNPGALDSMILGVETLLSQFTDLIINNSAVGKKYYLEKKFPAEKMVVVPNGIDLKRFYPDPTGREKVRQEWNISEDQVVIGLPARINPMKDHPNFLRAASLLKDKYPNLVFVCVGKQDDQDDSQYMDELKQLGSELGLQDRVLWTGGRTDMLAVHNAFDISVSASAYGEGFSNTVGESMACGNPCVVTDVGDSAWIVGELGEVVSPGDHQALAEKIGQMVDGLEGCDRQAVRQKIVDQFSVEQLAINTEKFLNQVLTCR